MDNPTRAIILMGVSGCGKTTVGRLLAERLGWAFVEGDAYHTSENVARMTNGVPLTDEDRWPWLIRLHNLLRENAQAETPLVMACSALKASYRKILTGGLEGIAFVYMQGSYDLIQERLSTRKNHYMKAGMLQSQFDSLEEPQSALVVTIAASPQEIVQKVIDHYRLRAS